MTGHTWPSCDPHSIADNRGIDNPVDLLLLSVFV
jgi:hypothetical protein